MKHWKTTLVVFAMVCASLAVADDIKTINGKEYKNATVSRVEPDGITVKFSGGLVKILFTELSRELQEKYHYDPDKAAAAQAAAMAAIQETNQQVEESNKQRREAEQQKALENRLSQLQQQEENLRVQIGQAENAPTAGQQAGAATRQLEKQAREEELTPQEKAEQLAWRQRQYEGAKTAAARQGLDSNMIVPPRYGDAEYDPLSQIRGAMGGGSAQSGEQTPVSEADFLRLQSQLDSVRKEKEQVKQELARKAQRQP
jgi:uncharacterized protein YnzC (UPF0291/DUF896 family)